MRPPVTYSVPYETTSPRFAQAFAQGCGGCVCVEDDLKPGPVALFGSPARWRLLQQAREVGREWFYGDHGYFGRTTFYRITRNAYQHDGQGTATSERFDWFNRPVQPWRADGRHVLVCPNSDTYFRLFGTTAAAWLAQVTAALAQSTDRPVRVRWKGQADPIDRDLRHCWAVVAFSSAAALDALIAGVPVFVLAPFAAAARMGLADVQAIETPRYPDDREAFLWNLAQQQWTLAEIRSGEAWRALRAAA